jgi:hypothetical protein
MRKLLLAVAVSAVASLVLSSVALAWTPPGQKGYEGHHHGNQGGYHQAGQTGYEGNPGNQGGK